MWQESTGKLSVLSVWSEWRDLNSRPYGPEPYALPNCATPRYYKFAFTSTVASLGARRAFPLGLAFFTVDLKSYRILGISLVLFPLLSQTKLRYTPIIFCKTDSINPTAFAIYNNWRIFATKTRHLSQNLSFATLFFIYDWQNRLQNVEHWYIITHAMELGVVVALGPLTPTV